MGNNVQVSGLDNYKLDTENIKSIGEMYVEKRGSVVARVSISRYLTEKKPYEILAENDGNYIIVADDGTELGFSKDKFVDPNAVVKENPLLKFLNEGTDPSAPRGSRITALNFLSNVETEFGILYPESQMAVRKHSVLYLVDILEYSPNVSIAHMLEVFDKEMVDTACILLRKKGMPMEQYIAEVSSDEYLLMLALENISIRLDLTYLKIISKREVELIKEYHSLFIKLRNIVKNVRKE